jgi:hypothetical protein
MHNREEKLFLNGLLGMSIYMEISNAYDVTLVNLATSKNVIV